MRRNLTTSHASNRRIARTLLPATCLALLTAAPARADSSLQVTYGAKGVATLSFAGITLEDVGVSGGDAFHIWHTRLTDLKGNVLNGSEGQYGWGETNNGEAWDSSTATETYTFSWGAIATRFAQSGNNLDMIVTETNHAGSGVILDGAEIYPFALHFPQDPTGFSGYTQYVITTLEPGVSIADFGSGVVTSVIPNGSLALYGGWKSAGSATYTPILSGTAPDGLPSFLPSNQLPVQPGASLTYTVSLRFTPEGTPAAVTDAYASFAAAYPSQMTWSDHRAIGTAYLASSPFGNSSQPGGFPTNPRRYFNDATVDITTAPGLQAFQNRMLAQAESNAANAQALNAQAVITWDIEGEEYPQSTSYVCSPDQIAAVAPEMESRISDAGSAYYGQKLDDAYFKTIASAGLKIGLCLRPQVFTQAGNGAASQVFLSNNAAIVANLENKARLAHTRWGATVFYVDSTVDQNGGTLDPAIFERLITDLPGFLFIPEESTPRYYAYTAPFYSFLFHTTTGTPASTYGYYPHAFGANLVNDVSASTLAEYQPQLTAAVREGDLLMGHVDYWQQNDSTIVAIYEAAGVVAPAPGKVAPVLTWAVPAPIVSGTALTSTQLNAAANVAGAFVYQPPAGTVPGVGSTQLSVAFTPADTSAYSAQTASVVLTVDASAPAPVHASTLSITSPPGGSKLSGSIVVSGQCILALDSAGTFLMVDGVEVGTHRVTGAPFAYPFDTKTVTNGPHTLQLWGHDTANHTTVSASVPVTVAN